MIKDLVNKGEIEIKHTPTHKMWIDVLTKPMIGQKYCEMCSELSNCPVDYVGGAEWETTHPDLSPTGEIYGPIQGFLNCAGKTGVGSPIKLVKTDTSKTISW